MNTVSRRHFLQQTAGLAFAAIGTSAFGLKEQAPLLSFSTLGCPDWTFPQIVQFATQHGYKGLEFRGIQRELYLPKCKEFSSPENIAASRRLMRDNNLKFINLGSSAAMHHSNAAERQKNLDEAKRFIDLAAQLQCPYIRVFPNDFPKDEAKEATIDRIVKGLQEVGDYAKGTPVTVLMETHGQVVWSKDLAHILTATDRRNVGLIWDIVNMWVVTKEAPATVYGDLKKFIKHVHIKDLNVVDGKLHYTLVGKGEAPTFEGIDVLRNDGYNGYYSFEWEKLWHPEIAEPELALADYSKTMNQHFKKR
jgi:sugar phosphate isomerase/epimerase